MMRKVAFVASAILLVGCVHADLPDVTCFNELEASGISLVEGESAQSFINIPYSDEKLLTLHVPTQVVDVGIVKFRIPLLEYDADGPGLISIPVSVDVGDLGAIDAETFSVPVRYIVAQSETTSCAPYEKKLDVAVTVTPRTIPERTAYSRLEKQLASDGGVNFLMSLYWHYRIGLRDVFSARY